MNKETINKLSFLLRKHGELYTVVFLDGYRRPATGPEVKLWELLEAKNV